MAQLCTLEYVKIFLDKQDTDGDTLLGVMIDGISARMIAVMPAFSLHHLVVSEPHYDHGEGFLVVDDPPITSLSRVTSVVEGTGDSLAAGLFRLEGTDTIVRTNADNLTQGWGAPEVFVSYSSGYPLDEIPDDVAYAAAMQTAYEWQLTSQGQSRLGTSSSSPKEGDNTSLVSEGWLGLVKITLRQYGAGV